MTRMAMTIIVLIMAAILCIIERVGADAHTHVLSLPSFDIHGLTPRNGTANGGTLVVIATSDMLPQVTRVTIGGVDASLISQTNTSVTVRTGSNIGTCTVDVAVHTSDQTVTLPNSFTIDAVPVLPCTCRKLPVEFTGMWGQLRTISPVSSTVKGDILTQLTQILAVDASQVVSFNNSGSDSSLIGYKFIPSLVDPVPASNRASMAMYLQLVDMIRMRSSILLRSKWTSLLDLTYLPRPIPVRACFDDSYMQPCPPTPPAKNGRMDGIYNGLMFGFTIGLVLSSFGVHYYFNMNKRRHKANLAAFMRRDPEAL